MLLQLYIGEEAFGSGSAPLPWAMRDAAGRLVDSGVALPASMPRADRCEAVLAAPLALLTSVKVPRRGEKLRQLARFAVEEQLIAEPESVHVALGKSSPDGTLALAVVDRGRLDTLLRSLRESGLALRALWPEAQLLPLPRHGWSLAWTSGRGVLRTGPQAGTGVEPEAGHGPPRMLELALRQARRDEAPPEVLEVLTRAGEAEPDLAAWGAALNLEVKAGDPWDWSAAALVPDSARINLLQGEFATSVSTRDLWRGMKPVAALAAVVVLLNAGAVVAHWLALEHERDRIRAEMTSTLRATFPETQTIVDAPLQMRRKLGDLRAAAGLGGPSDLLPMLAKVSAALPRNMIERVSRLDYGRGTLTLEFAGASASDMAALRQSLAVPGLRAQALAAEGAGRGPRLSVTVPQ